MERLAELIGKLKEQFEEKADHTQLLVTTQMIEEVLTRSLAAPAKEMSTSKVAVVMPSPRVQTVGQAESITRAAAKKPAPVSEEETRYQPVAAPAIEPEPVMKKVEQLEHIEEQIDAIEPAPPKQNSNHWSYDPVKEIPTLASQEVFRDLNEVIGLKDASLNDHLKGNVMEIGHRLTETPIRDLKKAIGVNDRFVFINELFRGDEVMYERSIKTINGFQIYAEAEYWIERELKVKLGWEEDRLATRQFIQLVKRRFAR